MATNSAERHDEPVRIVGLSDGDLQYLREYDRKQQLLRDRVAGVAMGQPGLIVDGRGGSGKSMTIRDELDRRRARQQWRNSHMTGRALFDSLQQFPDAIFVIEDAEGLLRDKAGLGVLRSATWGGRPDRLGNPMRSVTWNALGSTKDFTFTGGIIVVSNRPLSSSPELAALATRVDVVHFNPTDAEIAAVMHRTATAGFSFGDRRLDPDECKEVANFVIQEAVRYRRPLDMRMLIRAYHDYLQVDAYEAGLSWQDLVASSLAGQPSVIGSIEPYGLRAKHKSEELAFVRQIIDVEPGARLAAWQQETYKSRAALYRRMQELVALDALDFEN